MVPWRNRTHARGDADEFLIATPRVLRLRLHRAPSGRASKRRARLGLSALGAPQPEPLARALDRAALSVAPPKLECRDYARTSHIRSNPRTGVCKIEQVTVMRNILKRLPRGLRRSLGDVRRSFRALPARTRRQKKRLLEDASLVGWERDLLARVEGAIHFNDGMYTGDAEHYYRVGLSAIRCIEEAVRAAGLKEVRSILDLPSGSGRVMRFLTLRFPDAKLTACDIQRDAS